MWGSTRIPSKVYQALYPLKKHLRCAQARHFLVCCWLVIALIRDPGKETQGAPIVPAVHAEILDDVADDAVGPMGCAGRGVHNGDRHAPYASSSG